MSFLCNKFKYFNNNSNLDINSIDYGNKTIPLFSFKGINTTAKIVSIYDGDTCQCVIIYNKQFIRLKVRLNGIDTPEIRIPEQKEKAIKAKQYLEELCSNNGYIMFIECLEFDKYGRLLANLFFNKEDFKNNKPSINTLMITSGHAYEYNGGTKHS